MPHLCSSLFVYVNSNFYITLYDLFQFYLYLCSKCSLHLFVYTASEAAYMLHLWCKDSNNPITVSADNHPTKQHLFYMFYSPQEKYMLKLHLIDWTRVVTQARDLSLGRGFP